VKHYLLLLFFFGTFSASATHLRGGFIQNRLVSGTQYEATITVYSDNVNGTIATQTTTSLSICWGDGTTELVPRLSLSPLQANNNGVLVGQFRAVHTYAGPGNYTIRSVIENRTPTTNLTQVGSNPFCMQTDLLIPTSSQRTNQLPVLNTILTAATNATIGQPIALSFRATDADGDSLAYTVARPLLGQVPCAIGPLSAAQYQYPNAVAQRGIYRLNTQTGELVWNAPTAVGLYTMAVYVNEYRNGLIMSRTYHEITLQVVEGGNIVASIPIYEPVTETPSGLILATEASPETSLQLLVAPNPVADDYLTVTIFCTVCAEGTLFLHDLTGRVVQQTSINPVQGRDEQRLDVRALSPGVYLLRAEMAGHRATQKVLKR
jgi:outer membrane protein assembly factor BamB